MRIKYRFNEDELTLYREPKNVIIFFIFMLLAITIVSLASAYMGYTTKSDGIFKYVHLAWYAFSAMMIIFAIGALSTLPNHIKRLKKNNGAIILKANKDHLVLAAETNGEPFNYSWDDIETIYFAKTYQQKQSSEDSTTWNRLVIYFTHDFHNKHFKPQESELLKRNKTNIWNAYNGSSYFVTGFSRKYAPEVIQHLITISPEHIHIGIYKKVIVDYSNKSEQVIS